MGIFIVCICVLIIAIAYHFFKTRLLDSNDSTKNTNDSSNDRITFQQYQAEQQKLTSENVIPLLSDYLSSINIGHLTKEKSILITYQGENIPFVTVSCSLDKDIGCVMILYPDVCHFENIEKGKEVCRRINEENDLVCQFDVDEDGDVTIDALLNIQQIESVEKLEAAIGYVFALADHYYPEFIQCGGIVTMRTQVSHTLEPSWNK